MSRNAIARALALLAAMTLVACGEDGGGGSNAAELKTEADVVRELATLATYLNSPNSGELAKSSGPGPSSPSIRPRYANKVAGMRQAAQTKPATPKAAEQHDCDSGFTLSDFLEAQPFHLPLFSVNPTMDSFFNDHHDCVYTSEGTSISFDGHEEDGNNYHYANGTVAEPWYEYYISGTGNTPSAFGFSDPEGDFVISALGREESRDNGETSEYREVISVDFEGTSGSESFSASVQSGTDGHPFTTVYDYGDDSFTIDGPLTYSSDFCDGGTLQYSTIEPMTFGSDEDGDFVNGGQIVIASGHSSVTVTFQLDGGATYEISNGTTGSFTREELENAPTCVLAV